MFRLEPIEATGPDFGAIVGQPVADRERPRYAPSPRRACRMPSSHGMRPSRRPHGTTFGAGTIIGVRNATIIGAEQSLVRMHGTPTNTGPADTYDSKKSLCSSGNGGSRSLAFLCTVCCHPAGMNSDATQYSATVRQPVSQRATSMRNRYCNRMVGDRSNLPGSMILDDKSWLPCR